MGALRHAPKRSQARVEGCPEVGFACGVAVGTVLEGLHCVKVWRPRQSMLGASLVL